MRELLAFSSSASSGYMGVKVIYAKGSFFISLVLVGAMTQAAELLH